MKSLLFFFLTLLGLWTCQGYPRTSFPNSDPLERGGIFGVELIENGTTYSFTSMYDGSVITVLPNGEVITDIWTGSPYQKWTIYEHKLYPLFLEFQQAVVPYNMLSGYEPIPEEPGIYPRPLGLNKHRIMPDDDNDDPTPWNICPRGIYCLENMGLGKIIEMADCEYNQAPWQFWELKIVHP